jgi:phage terminase small subunit
MRKAAKPSSTGKTGPIAGAPKRKPGTDVAGMNDKMQAFVDAYLADPHSNAAAAYRQAGYRCSESAARTAASRLLRHPAVIKAIDAARAKVARNLNITRERVAEEYAKIAFFNLQDCYDEDGALKNIADMDRDVVAAIAGIEVDEEYDDLPPDEELEGQPHGGALKRRSANRIAIGRTSKIKVSDKRAALDSIVKLFGWSKELGTPENPISMLLHDVGQRQAGLMPVADDPEDSGI